MGGRRGGKAHVWFLEPTLLFIRPTVLSVSEVSVSQTSWQWLYPEPELLRGRAVLVSRGPRVCPAGSGFESSSIETSSPAVSSTPCLARFWDTATALTRLISLQLCGTPALPSLPSMARPGRHAVLQVWPFHPKDTAPNLPPPATLQSATTAAAGESCVSAVIHAFWFLFILINPPTLITFSL